MTESNVGLSSFFKLLSNLYSSIPTDRKFFAFVAVIALIASLAIKAPPLVSITLLFLLLGFIIWSMTALEKSNETSVALKSEYPTYGMFISSPMASLSDDDARNRQAVEIAKIKAALKKSGLEQASYHAASDRPKEDDFSLPNKALPYNWRCLRNSKYYIAILTDNSVSSTYLEVGAALALKIPSVWFVHKDVKLPFLMSDGDKASENDTLPIVRVYHFQNLEEISAKITKYQLGLFS